MLTRRVLMAGAGTSLFAARAAAQADRTIRIVSGFPAGGGIDLSARLLVDSLKDAFSQSVITVALMPGSR